MHYINYTNLLAICDFNNSKEHSLVELVNDLAEQLLFLRMLIIL